MAEASVAEMIAQSPKAAKDTILKLQRHNRLLAQRIADLEQERMCLKERICMYESARHIGWSEDCS
jgi:hypothetical protein